MLNYLKIGTYFDKASKIFFRQKDNKGKYDTENFNHHSFIFFYYVDVCCWVAKEIKPMKL